MEIIDNDRPILYLSGWLGAGRQSATFKWLQKHFANLECVAAGGSADFRSILAEIAELRKSTSEPIVVGNSYGGFVASLLDLPAVLINPCLYPSTALPKIAVLDKDEVKAFRDAEYSRDASNTAEDRQRFWCVLSDSDEIIGDHKISAVSFRKPVVVAGGRHKLTDEQRDLYVLPLIKKVLSIYPTA